MNALLIGLGAIGIGYDIDQSDLVQTHAKALAVYGANVTAVDPIEAKRNIANRAYGFRVFSTLDELPRMTKFDLIIIASSTGLHFLHLQWAFMQSPKIILIEKPIAETSKQLDIIADLASSSPTQLMVNVIRNYDPIFLMLCAEFKSEFFGVVEYSKSMMHNGVHFLALLIKVFGPVIATQKHNSDIEKPTVKFLFSAGYIEFIPVRAGDENSLKIHSMDEYLEFVDGGRTIKIKRSGREMLTLKNRLSHYQELVMEKLLRCLDGEQDDSFSHVLSAQRHILSVTQKVEL